jgi:hypothetical protein
LLSEELKPQLVFPLHTCPPSSKHFLQYSHTHFSLPKGIRWEPQDGPVSSSPGEMGQVVRLSQITQLTTGNAEI